MIFDENQENKWKKIFFSSNSYKKPQELMLLEWEVAKKKSEMMKIKKKMDKNDKKDALEP